MGLNTSDPIQTYGNAQLLPAYSKPDAAEIAVALDDGTYVAGTVLGELTASPGTYAAYASGHTDGTQVAKALLRYACVAASGVITGLGDNGQGRLTTTAYITGAFRTADLTGLDSTALASLQAHYISGADATGIIVL